MTPRLQGIRFPANAIAVSNWQLQEVLGFVFKIIFDVHKYFVSIYIKEYLIVHVWNTIHDKIRDVIYV